MEGWGRTREGKGNARGTIEVADTQSDAAAHGVADAAAAATLFIETRPKPDSGGSLYRLRAAVSCFLKREEQLNSSVLKNQLIEKTMTVIYRIFKKYFNQR